MKTSLLADKALGVIHFIVEHNRRVFILKRLILAVRSVLRSSRFHGRTTAFAFEVQVARLVVIQAYWLDFFFPQRNNIKRYFHELLVTFVTRKAIRVPIDWLTKLADSGM